MPPRSAACGVSAPAGRRPSSCPFLFTSASWRLPRAPGSHASCAAIRVRSGKRAGDVSPPMPNILIVAYRFPPDFGVGAKRAHRIAAHLAGRGWGVQILTVRPLYYEGLDPTLLDPDPGFEIVRTHALTPQAWGRGLRTAFGGKPIEDASPAAPSTGPAPRMSVMERLSRVWDLLFSLPDEWSGWIPPALAAGLMRARRADLILATGPPFSGIVAAAVLAKASHRPLVLDYRDPWTTFPSAIER